MRAAEARARGPDGGRLAARAVGEAQLPGTWALNFPGPGAPCRQAAPARHTRQQAPGGSCGEKSRAESGRPDHGRGRGGARRLALSPPPLAKPRYLSSLENGSYPLAKL